MRRLADEGFHSFYYVSHAPFLFANLNTEALARIQRILKNAGIPERSALRNTGNKPKQPVRLIADRNVRQRKLFRKIALEKSGKNRELLNFLICYAITDSSYKTVLVNNFNNLYIMASASTENRGKQRVKP